MDGMIQHYDPDGVEIESGMWYPGMYLGWDLDGNWVESGFAALPPATAMGGIRLCSWRDVSDILKEYSPIQTQEAYKSMLSNVQSIPFFNNLVLGITGDSGYVSEYSSIFLKEQPQV